MSRSPQGAPERLSVPQPLPPRSEPAPPPERAFRSPPPPPPGSEAVLPPWREQDACGVGFVAQATGEPSHDVLRMALTALARLAHRGAASNAHSGDGAGVLTQIPRRLLAGAGSGRRLALGMFFLPQEDPALGRAVALIERALKEVQLPVLGWRDVPVDPPALGPLARAPRPTVRQAFVAVPLLLGKESCERRLYLARRIIERRAAQAGLTSLFTCSLSRRNVVYKALLTGTELPAFYPDLRSALFETAIAVFHQRYSTNTLPSWPLAQPFRLLAHNGEINTLWGNRNAMRAREPALESPVWGRDVEHLKPVLWPDGSDSASLDNALELLRRAGRDPANVVESSRLGPGDLLIVDTARGLILRSADAKRAVARRRPYGRWVARRVHLLRADTSSQVPRTSAAELVPRQRAFGYSFEDLRYVVTPMVATGQDAIWSMGDDTPIAPLSRVPQTLYAYFRQRFAQVTNPAIDPLRESRVMSLRMYLGPRGSLLTPHPPKGRRPLVRLEHPILCDEELTTLRDASELEAVTVEAWDVPHCAALFGYGAEAVCPWLALESATVLGAGPEARASSGQLRAALEQGLRKVLSKMGISTLQSYAGAQVFEALGLGAAVIERCFSGTTSVIGGIGLTEIAADVLERHRAAYGGDAGLPDHGRVRYRRDGEDHGWAPPLVRALQDAVRPDPPPGTGYEAFRQRVQARHAAGPPDPPPCR